MNEIFLLKIQIMSPQDSYGCQSSEPAASSAGATDQVSPRGHLLSPAAPVSPQHRLLPACLR